jgi:Fe-S-cluster containining protein
LLCAGARAGHVAGFALIHPMDHPCLRCGACCAFFRVAFHWSEAEGVTGGSVPLALTEKLDLHRLAMRNDHAAKPRCIALVGVVGSAAHCSIYQQRPSVCREVVPSWEFGAVSSQCDRARLGHGLAPLTRDDWPAAHASATAAD